MAIEGLVTCQRQEGEKPGAGQLTYPRVGHGAVLSGLSLPASDLQKPRIHPRPGPERLPQFPYLVLPQCYHVPRPSTTPGMEQMELSGDSGHHLLGLGLEMALWGVGYIPWHWRSQFPLSTNRY